MIYKLKKLFRLFFPINENTLEYFEKRLKWLPDFSFFKFIEGVYIINFKSNFKIAMRDLNHSDIIVYSQIFIDEEYKILKEILKNLNHEGELRIIDAGANVGYTSLYFARDLNSKIVSIEPSFSNLHILNKNVILNNLSNQIDIKYNALSSNSDHKYNIDNNFRDGLDWSCVTKKDQNGNITSITIENILIENNWEYIDFLKIDIEGAEKEIFLNNIDFLKKTKLIAIEIHEEFISEDYIKSLLIQNSFIVFNTGELTVGINKLLI